MSPKKHYRSSRRSSRRQSDNSEGALRFLAVRAGAVVGLVVLIVLLIFEVSELRGELAFKRFYRLERLAEKSRDRDSLSRAVENASSEAELVMFFGKGNPDALWEITVSCLEWSGREELNPILRLRLAERAVGASALAVCAAPSDYEPWLWLARSQAVLGLASQAESALKRAQELAPPGTKLLLLPVGSEGAEGPSPLRVAGGEGEREADG